MRPDYSSNDPKGWRGDPKRGAALGRPANHSHGFSGRLCLRRVRLNSGGYDRNGTYFGSGSPLYWCASNDGSVDFVFRATNRATARYGVLHRYPKAQVRK